MSGGQYSIRLVYGLSHPQEMAAIIFLFGGAYTLAQEMTPTTGCLRDSAGQFRRAPAVWLVENVVSTRCASSESQFDALREVRCPWHARGKWHCRRKLLAERRSKRKRTAACSIGRVSTRFGEVGGQVGRSIVEEPGGSALNPCARESKTPTGGFLRGTKLIHPSCYQHAICAFLLLIL